MSNQDFIRGLKWVQVLVEAMLKQVKPKDYHRACLDIIDTIEAQIDDMAANSVEKDK